MCKTETQVQRFINNKKEKERKKLQRIKVLLMLLGIYEVSELNMTIINFTAIIYLCSTCEEWCYKWRRTRITNKDEK